MKIVRRLGAFLLALVMFAVAIPAANSAPDTAADVTEPELVAAELVSAATVGVGDEVIVEWTVRDESELSSVDFWFSGPHGQSVVVDWNSVTGDEPVRDGDLWHGRSVVAIDAESDPTGDYVFNRASLIDQSWNPTTVRASAISIDGFYVDNPPVTEPTEPVESPEPTEPVESLEPTEPEESPEPVDPTEPEESPEPTEPVESPEPTDPVEPTEPVESPEPTEPVESLEPTEPEESPEPTDPVIEQTARTAETDPVQDGSEAEASEEDSGALAQTGANGVALLLALAALMVGVGVVLYRRTRTR